MQIISWFKKAPSSLKFFDFGMGWGEWALMAKAFGCRSYGAELSNICIEYAKANGINIVSWDEIPQSQFDFINTEQVFEHISNPLQTLCHLKKGLKANGLLKISVPTVNFMERRLRIMDWNSPKGARNSHKPDVLWNTSIFLEGISEHDGRPSWNGRSVSADEKPISIHH